MFRGKKVIFVFFEIVLNEPCFEMGLAPFAAGEDGTGSMFGARVAVATGQEIVPKSGRALARPQCHVEFREDSGPASLHVAHLTMPTPRRFVKQPHSSKQFQYVRKTTRLRCGFRCPYFRTLLDPEMKEIGI